MYYYYYINIVVNALGGETSLSITTVYHTHAHSC